MLLTETGQTLKAYCNIEGEYTFTLPDSLNGRSIIIRALQDESKIKEDSIREVCSYNCTISEIYLASTERVKLKINTDSIKNYIVDFSVVTATLDFYTPVLYFKKNELQLVQSDYSLSTDSALCEITSIFQCNKQFCIEIRGNCSPKEKNKDNLSLHRATLVRNRLIALGVNPKRLVAKGYADEYYQSMKKYYKTEGDFRPAYINKTDYEGQTVRFAVIRRDFKD
jgi:hypothetical protein